VRSYFKRDEVCGKKIGRRERRIFIQKKRWKEKKNKLDGGKQVSQLIPTTTNFVLKNYFTMERTIIK